MTDKELDKNAARRLAIIRHAQKVPVSSSMAAVRLPVWYGRGGITVGVLTHGADNDYDRGRRLTEQRQPLPAAAH